MGGRLRLRHVSADAGAAKYATLGLHEVDLWAELAGHLGVGGWAYGPHSGCRGSEVVRDRRGNDNCAIGAYDNNGSWDDDGARIDYLICFWRYAIAVGTVWWNRLERSNSLCSWGNVCRCFAALLLPVSVNPDSDQ